MDKNAKNILIIEDEEGYQKALFEKLTRLGCNVILESNGKDGLSKALKVHPDLILLDLIMPQLDGIHVLKQLRMDDWGKNAEVIVLTALSDTKKIAQVVEQKTFDYIVKTDIHIDDLVLRIKEKLGIV